MPLPREPGQAPVTMEDIQAAANANPLFSAQLQATAWRRVALELEDKLAEKDEPDAGNDKES